MTDSIFEAEEIIRDTFVSKAPVTLQYTFDINNMTNAAPTGYAGNLSLQNDPFAVAHMRVIDTRRSGASRISPTRNDCDLELFYYTKTPSTIKDSKFLESVAYWFAEQNINQIRFRTYTPSAIGAWNGFTVYNGAISFDFDLYRGDRS